MKASISSKFLAVAALAAGALGVATAAQARTDVHLSIGVPAQPVYVAPQPVYAQPQPVYVQPQPVFVQPRPVVVRPAPVFAPAPVHVVPRGPGWRDRDDWRREEWRRRHWHNQHERRW